MSDIILHHYWPSPVAEKVRVYLGFKGIRWKSVEIPRIPPKPDVIALTGGYRRTPVMQIGADIYCDSQCILRELERRHPDKGGAVLPWGLSRWTDGEAFTHAIRVVLGAQVESLDRAFLEDRARLYFGSQWTAESIAAGVDSSLNYLAAAFDWIDQELTQENRSEFLSGTTPGLADAFCYYLVWFVQGRFAGGPELVARYPQLHAWMQRVEAIGYGEYDDLSSTDAIAIAHKAKLSQDVTEGIQVSVQPDGDGGDPAVTGTLVKQTLDEFIVQREDERAGMVHVHFPVVGYLLTRL
ncbi:MAG: glutathione S-transferase family protein [Granulosicoccus sp.]|nr:glutathione S-transferase family protein [Granulosicoccus sp.]